MRDPTGKRLFAVQFHSALLDHPKIGPWIMENKIVVHKAHGHIVQTFWENKEEAKVFRNHLNEETRGNHVLSYGPDHHKLSRGINV
jgi:hypothetical protein